MDFLTPLLATRLIFILGITNLVTGTLIFFSCRCLGGSKLGGRLMKHPAFARFYRHHCFLWRVFWVSVVLHALLALTFLGWPG
ncbi:MAG: hypothetical protein ABID87_02575 [Chloroflexota bacterium]